MTKKKKEEKKKEKDIFMGAKRSRFFEWVMRLIVAIGRLKFW